VDGDVAANIDDHSHTGVRALLQCFRLCFAKDRPRAIAVVAKRLVVVGELDKSEREVTLIPPPAPIGDHEREEFFVEYSYIVRTGVAFALIPNHSAHGVGDDRVDHRVEKTRRCELHLDEIDFRACGQRLRGYSWKCALDGNFPCSIHRHGVGNRQLHPGAGDVKTALFGVRNKAHRDDIASGPNKIPGDGISSRCGVEGRRLPADAADFDSVEINRVVLFCQIPKVQVKRFCSGLGRKVHGLAHPENAAGLGFESSGQVEIRSGCRPEIIIEIHCRPTVLKALVDFVLKSVGGFPSGKVLRKGFEQARGLLHAGDQIIGLSFEFRHGVEGLPAGPRLSGRSSIARFNDSHRDAEFLIEVTGEKIADSGEATDCVRRADGPIALDGVQGGERTL